MDVMAADRQKPVGRVGSRRQASVKSLGVFWFQDDAGVKVPTSWHVEASDDQAGPWLKVPSSDGKFGVELDVYNTVQFRETLKDSLYTHRYDTHQR